LKGNIMELLDEVDGLALELGEKFGASELQSLAKALAFIAAGRGFEQRNGSSRAPASVAPAAKVAPAKATKGSKTPPPPADEEEPGF